MTVTTEKGGTRTTTAGTSSQDKTINPILNSVENTNDVENVIALLSEDNNYRKNTLSLTASENHQSLLTRFGSSSYSNGFYQFFPPYKTEKGEWYFPDSIPRETITKLLRPLGQELFHSQTFDERPNGGSAAEQAVLLGTCNRGDAWAHVRPTDGGHFGNEAISQKMGLQEVFLPVNSNGLVDLKKYQNLIQKHPNLKLVLLDQSHKLRYQPLPAIREVTPPNVLLVYDCSHDGGLIAGGMLPQPLDNGADALIGNTHKTMPGPNKAFIAFANKEHPQFKSVSEWICPFLQSNCHAELILPLLIALLEMKAFGAEYAQQTVKNAKALAKALVDEGFHVAGEQFDYTETQQVHLILGSSQAALECVSEILPTAGIRANNIQIPGLNHVFGLRLGTQAITRRGMQEVHVVEIAKLLARLLLKKEPASKIQLEVRSLLQEFPLFPLPYSFDYLVEDDLGQALLRRIIQ